MKRYLSIIFFIFLSVTIYSQDIYEDVYNIFQNNCMPCHNSATQTSYLDLEGVGSNTAQKMATTTRRDGLLCSAAPQGRAMAPLCSAATAAQRRAASMPARAPPALG